MTSLHRLQRGVSAAELAGWTLIGAGFGAVAGLRLAGSTPNHLIDASILLAALGALPLPLRMLALLSTPPNAKLRRALGESSSSLARQAVRDASVLVVCWTLSVSAGLAITSGTKGSLLAACVASVGVWGVWMMLLALHQVAAGAKGPWQAISGGGAFGPADTAPLLYAPAFAFTGGLMLPVLIATVGAAVAANKTTTADQASTIWLIQHAALSAAIVIPVLGTVLTLGMLPARAALLRVELAHELGFYRAEHLSQTPRYLTLLNNRADLQLLADIWHRRFPASAFVTVALACAAAWFMAGTEFAPPVGFVAGAIVLYSAGRAADLQGAEPQTLGTARFLGSHDPADAVRKLGLGLALPSVVLIGLAWSSGAWAATLVGLVIALAVATFAPLRIVAVAGRVAPLLAVASAAIAPGAG
jgi:hypothetical protein